MTYTVVYRDYRGTFEQAAAACLRDRDIYLPADPDARGRVEAGHIGYSLDHWEWQPDAAVAPNPEEAAGSAAWRGDPNPLSGTLRAWFR